MANIKISQLPNINGNLTTLALIPIVSTNGTLITDKITVANLANYILGQSGNLIVNANIANLAYSVINAAQPNITSVGTLSNLAVSGVVNLGSVDNLIVLGGNTGQVLTTNGNGELSWSNSAGATGATGPVGDRYATSSVSNLTIATGNISLSVEQGLAYTVGQDITVVYNTVNYMAGPVVTYDKLTGALTFNSITTLGSGSYSSWTVNLDGAVGAQGATGATGPQGATGAIGNKLLANLDANGFFISNAANITANYFLGTATNVVVEAVNNNYSYHVVLTTGAGDSTLHNDIDDNFQYNPADGILTVTRADTEFLSVSNSVISNLIPFDSIPLTLGNATNPWNDLYLSNSTIYLGNATISANGNSIVVDNITVTNNGALTVSQDINGNGNLRLQALANGNTTINLSDTADIDMVANVGNINLYTANNNPWIFDNTGNAEFPGNIRMGASAASQINTVANSSGDGSGYTTLQLIPDETLVGADQYLIVDPTGGGHIHIRAGGQQDDSSAILYLGGERNYVKVEDGGNGVKIQNEYVYVQPYSYFDPADFTNASWYSNSGQNYLEYTSTNAELDTRPYQDVQSILVSWNSGANSEYINQSGVASLGGGVFRVTVDQPPPSNPTAITGIEFDINITNTSYVSLNNNDIYSESKADTTLFAYGTIELVSQSNVGYITLTTDNGNSSHQWNFGSDGNLTLPGNTFAVNYANGTQVPLGGGGNTGNVTFDNNIVIGTGDEYGSNGLYLATGPNGAANLQYLRVRGGDFPTHIHLDTGNNDAYDQYFGNDSKYVKLGLGLSGNVSIGTYNGALGQLEWIFDSNGGLVLAWGNSVIQSIANSNLDPTNPNVSTMVLTPDANYSSQALVLDPTAPGHIHLRAFASSNIDEPSANIFLGGENTAFEVTSGSNNKALIHSNNFTWTFGNDGNLQVPGDVFANTGASPAPSLYGFSSLQVFDQINVGGVTITGSAGTDGQVLTTYANGVTYWSTVSGGGATGATGPEGATGATGPAGTNGAQGSTGATGPVAGSNTQIIFNDAGTANGNAGLTFNKTTGLLNVNGNVTANNFTGNITITGNVTGTSPNVSLVAGSYTWTFDNTGLLTLPAGGGNEGAEIDFTKAPNSTLSGNSIVIDNYVDKIRFFESGGTNRGAYIDLTQAAAGVGTLLNNRVSAASLALNTSLTLDNLAIQIRAQGSGVWIFAATVSGTATYQIALTFQIGGATTNTQGGTGAMSATTTPATIINAGWWFASAGQLATTVLTDTTNSKMYRITWQTTTASSPYGNFVSIERLV